MNSSLWFLAGVLMAAATGLFSWLLKRRQRHKRLLELSAYLEAASCGRETALSRTEDEFSLLEDELYKTVSELRIAREQAQQERERQAENLADIAHQIKTPLTSMSLMTQLLYADASPEQLEYLGRLDNQLTRLGWLTDSLLTMSRLDAGAIEFVPVTLTFEELAAQALDPLAQLIEERAQTVQLRGGTLTLSCDPHWSAEALVNLIKNCSEHTPAGGQILMEAVSTPLYFQIIVEDTGPGFDPSELPLLFRRFYRGKTSGKDSIGIGLALCRAIIEEQGGLVHAENCPEGGARFVLRFYS